MVNDDDHWANEDDWVTSVIVAERIDAEVVAEKAALLGPARALSREHLFDSKPTVNGLRKPLR